MFNSDSYAPPSLRNRVLFWFLVGIPMAFALFYYCLLASHVYIAESKVVIKHASAIETGGGTLKTLLGISAPSVEDALLLKEFATSSDMMDRLNEQMKLRDVFSDKGIDFVRRLSRSSTYEKFFDYYRSRVKVLFDEKTSMLTIRTEGFTPDFAQQFNQAILAESEKYINDVSRLIAKEQMDFADIEIERNRERLKTAQDDLVSYQNSKGMLNPQARAEAESKVIVSMEALQTQLKAELRNMLNYLHPDSAQVVAAKNTIESLQEQIRQEKAKLVAPGDDKLNQAAIKYMDIKAEVDFNADLYRTSLAAYEKTRVEAAQKLKNLVIISSPHKPEEYDWRRSLMSLATLLVVTSLLYTFVRLAWTIIEDHRD